MVLDEFRSYTGWNDYANRQQYAAPADPWRLVHVDPNTIEEYRSVYLLWGLGRVHGGDWDREDRKPLDETKIYAGLRERYLDGKPWEETAYYEWGVEGLDGQESFRGCADIEEFVEGRCAALDRMVDDLRTNGYRPNRGRLYDSPEDIEYIHSMEPIVLVDRDGEFLLTEGYHRIVLAQLFDIETVPVYVLQRHERWQRVRDAVVERGSVPREIQADGNTDAIDVDDTHPDLQDVLETTSVSESS